MIIPLNKGWENKASHSVCATAGQSNKIEDDSKFDKIIGVMVKQK